MTNSLKQLFTPRKDLLPRICLMLVVIVLFTSCKKNCGMEEEEQRPDIVIEGSITNIRGPYTITVKQIGRPDANGNNLFPVSGAEVTISDNSANTETLREVAAGIYQTVSTKGVEGRTYTLNVRIEGVTYTAVSRMPYSVELSDVVVEQTFDKDASVKSVEALFNDPGDEVNYYAFSMVRNDRMCEASFVFKDEQANGQTVSYKLEDEKPLKKGDRVQVLMQSIDHNQYSYYTTIPEQSRVAGNPSSNISNGALGYFSASSVSSKCITL